MDAARAAFAADGYDRASIRRIAADAGVDPALVHHYFATKERLFLASIEAPFDPAEVVPLIADGDPGAIGERLVAVFVRLWDGETGDRAAAFLRAALINPERASVTKDFVMTQIVREAIRRAIPTLDHSATRGSLVASQLLGLALTRHILKLPPLTGLGVDELVTVYGPTIQRYLTADAAELGING